MIAYNTQYEKHTLQTSLREDINSQYDNETTGSIGYAYQINSQWKASSSFGTAFVRLFRIEPPHALAPAILDKDLGSVRTDC